MYATLSELRHRVKILRPVFSEDGAGNLEETGESEVATVWAKVLPYAAKISDGYAEKVDEVNYRIAIRYWEDVEMTDILEWRGKRLSLSAPPYGMDGKCKYLILEARELVEDGKV